MGNAILNYNWFVAKTACESITKECRRGHRQIGNQHMVAVDTPGFLDTSLKDRNNSREIARSLQITVPGPHAFLIVLSCHRALAVAAEAWNSIEEFFPGNPFQYSIVVFTHLDNLQADNQTEDEFLEHHLTPAVKSLIKKCNDRVIFFNTRLRNEQQMPYVKKLLEMIVEMMKGNKNMPFINTAVVEMSNFVSRAAESGGYVPFQADGTINLLPQAEKIVVEAFLRRPQNNK